jgi:hypothetical protein
MKKPVLIAFVALALILSSCAAAKTLSPSYTNGAGAYPTAAAPGERSDVSSAGQGEVPPTAAPAYSPDVYDSSKGSTANAAGAARMIAMTVDLSLIVVDPQQKMDEINKLAQDLGGYLVSMNMSQVYASSGDLVPQGSISIRVPASKLASALDQIEADAIDVTSDNRAGQDVTSQYVDLQSQLKNLQQAEQDLQAIMDEAKNNPGNDSTTKTQDVLNVYNQIVYIRGQIESIQGQMKYLEETTSTSAINVALVAEETIQPIKVGHWQPQGVANEAIQSLIKFLQGFVDFLITLVLKILPELIIIFGPIALIIWAIVAGFKRRKARKAAKVS